MAESQSSSSPWRWMVLLSKALISFLGLGLFKTMGVFIPYFVDDLQTSAASVGAATGIYGSLCSVLAPIASAMTPCGPRKLVVVGGAVMAIGTMGAATSTSVLHLILWMSLSSTGAAFVNVCSIKPLMDYFPDSFATVIGIAFSAGTLGMMLLPPLAEWLIEIYDWRGALFLLGAATFHICVAGALLRPRTTNKSHPTTRYQQLYNEDETDACEKTRDEENQCGRIGRNCKIQFCSLRDRFDTRLFVDEPWFVLHQTAYFITGAVFAGWQLFLVPHSIALGYGNQMSSFLSTFGGLGSLVGRLTNGILTDWKLIKPVDLFILASILCAVSSLIDPLAVSSFAALATLATVTGLASGYTYPLLFVIVRDSIDEDRQMAAFGWLYLFVGMGQIFGGVFTGWVYDATRDYEIVFMMYGGLSLVVVPIMLASRLAGLCCNS